MCACLFCMHIEKSSLCHNEILEVKKKQYIARGDKMKWMSIKNLTIGLGVGATAVGATLGIVSAAKIINERDAHLRYKYNGAFYKTELAAKEAWLKDNPEGQKSPAIMKVSYLMNNHEFVIDGIRVSYDDYKKHSNMKSLVSKGTSWKPNANSLIDLKTYAVGSRKFKDPADATSYLSSLSQSELISNGIVSSANVDWKNLDPSTALRAKGSAIDPSLGTLTGKTDSELFDAVKKLMTSVTTDSTDTIYSSEVSNIPAGGLPEGTLVGGTTNHALTNSLKTIFVYKQKIYNTVDAAKLEWVKDNPIKQKGIYKIKINNKEFTFISDGKTSLTADDIKNDWVMIKDSETEASIEKNGVAVNLPANSNIGDVEDKTKWSRVTSYKGFTNKKFDSIVNERLKRGHSP